MQELARYAIRITSETPPEIDNAKGKEVLMDLKNSIHLVMDRLIQNGQQRGEIRMRDSRLNHLLSDRKFPGDFASDTPGSDQRRAESRAGAGSGADRAAWSVNGKQPGVCNLIGQKID